MNDQFRNTIKHLLATLIFMTLSCDKEDHEPFAACQGVDESQFSFIELDIVRFYDENIKIWPYH